MQSITCLGFPTYGIVGEGEPRAVGSVEGDSIAFGARVSSRPYESGALVEDGDWATRGASVSFWPYDSGALVDSDWAKISS